MRTGARWLLILAAVGLQNLLYFSLHYTQGWMIPWDFIGPYYALPQYWIEAAHAGVSSNWIPFQGMGYPIHLNVQSGFHYLPLQWFAWVGWPYTLTSAVVLQGLHVAFGALGAAWCAHLLRMDWKLALLAALAYQGFGGFYGNASHPDIVRAYALLPWLMGPVVAPWTDSTRLRVAVALVPLWTQMMWTGGYSGNAIATLALLGGVTAARTAFNVRQQPARWLGLALLAALGTGTLLAAPALLPAFMEKARNGAVLCGRQSDLRLPAMERCVGPDLADRRRLFRARPDDAVPVSGAAGPGAAGFALPAFWLGPGPGSRRGVPAGTGHGQWRPSRLADSLGRPPGL
jgi:hypothetical protein